MINLYENKKNKLIPNLLNGMYAYVIYDKINRQLQIVNDTQGEKIFIILIIKISLLYLQQLNQLRYLDLKQLNKDVIKNYFFTRHFMPLENTCYKDLKLFKSGTINFFDLKKLKLNSLIYDDPFNWIYKKNILS